MTAKPKKPAARKRAPKKKIEEAPTPEPAPVEAEPQEELPPQAFTPPEINFSARVPSVPDERPRPARRRAIFIDVENTSRPGRITEALADLHIDHATASTDIVASGNWRVIANETARMLARKGAQLVHSAPATGVRDWSDLRIAVSAGVWMASARPGDRLDIVSDDKAFDAVGDVAATLGVEFFRHMKKRGAAATHEPEAHAAAAPRQRRTRGGRGRGRRPERAAVEAVATPSEAAPEAAPVVEAAPSEPTGAATAAPEGDLLRVVSEQLMNSPNGVTLDAVANNLKKLGFVRPPGSPRLITRLRAYKELDVSPRGLIRLKGASGAAATEEPQPSTTANPERRRRRRGGRGRGGRARGGEAGAAQPAAPPAPITES